MEATDILCDVISTGKGIECGSCGRVFEVDYQGTLCAAKEVHALLLQYSHGEALHKLTTDFLNECRIQLEHHSSPVHRSVSIGDVAMCKNFCSDTSYI